MKIRFFLKIKMDHTFEGARIEFISASGIRYSDYFAKRDRF